MPRSHDINEFLNALHPSGVYEVRVFECPERAGGNFKSTAAGWFTHDDIDSAVSSVRRVSNLKPPGVFVTLNPVKAGLLALRRGKVETKAKRTTQDPDVLYRRRLVFDIDPAREISGSSATDEERAEAEKVCAEVRSHLKAEGWPEPIYGSSGNGFYLVYATEKMPNDDGAKELFAQCLASMAAKYGSEKTASVDKGVFSAAQLIKVLGTWSRKGEDIQREVDTGDEIMPARPHRQSWHEIPVDFDRVLVTKAQVRAIADQAPAVEPGKSRGKGATNAAGKTEAQIENEAMGFTEKDASRREFDLQTWLDEHNVPVGPAQTWRDGFKWVFTAMSPGCANSPSGHQDFQAAVITQGGDGAIGAGCLHDRCTWNWRDLREHYEPGCYDKQEGRKAREAAKQSGLPRLVIDPDSRNLSEVLSELTDILRETGTVFSHGGTATHVHNREVTAIREPGELIGLLSQYADVRYVLKRSSKSKPLDRQYATAWLHNNFEKSRLEAVARFASAPQFIAAGHFSKPGYDRRTGIYTQCTLVDPICGTEHIDELLREFAFAEPADRTNFIGLMLTAFLTNYIPGLRPGSIIAASQQGLGKTALAQVLAVIREGGEVDAISYHRDDAEMEKQISAKIGRTTFLIDNAKGCGAISSTIIERSITARHLSFRLLGTNKSISVENSHQFVITANTPKISNDLRQRSVLVSLDHKGAAEERQFQRMEEPKDYALRHLASIRGELMGMIKRWYDAGARSGTQQHRMRQWASIVGGILDFAGEVDFLQNAAAATEMDAAKQAWQYLVAEMAKLPNSITATRIHGILSPAGVLPDLDIPPRANSRAAATKIGIAARRFSGARFTVADKEFEFIVQTSGNNTTYAVELVRECIALPLEAV